MEFPTKLIVRVFATLIVGQWLFAAEAKSQFMGCYVFTQSYTCEDLFGGNESLCPEGSQACVFGQPCNPGFFQKRGSDYDTAQWDGIRKSHWQEPGYWSDANGYEVACAMYGSCICRIAPWDPSLATFYCSEDGQDIMENVYLADINIPCVDGY